MHKPMCQNSGYKLPLAAMGKKDFAFALNADIGYLKYQQTADVCYIAWMNLILEGKMAGDLIHKRMLVI